LLLLSNVGKVYSNGENFVYKNIKHSMVILGLKYFYIFSLGYYEGRNIPTLIFTLEEEIIQISAGHRTSLLLSSKGQVFSFGVNQILFLILK
jgi:hypothetical protein